MQCFLSNSCDFQKSNLEKSIFYLHLFLYSLSAIAQVLTGTLSCIFGFLFYLINADRDYSSFHITGLLGVAGGLLIFVTGLLGMISFKDPTSHCKHGIHMLLCICSWLSALGMIVIYAVGFRYLLWFSVFGLKTYIWKQIIKKYMDATKGTQLSRQRLAFGNQKFPVRVRLLAMSRGEPSAVIARLMSKCCKMGGSGW